MFLPSLPRKILAPVWYFSLFPCIVQKFNFPTTQGCSVFILTQQPKPSASLTDTGTDILFCLPLLLLSFLLGSLVPEQLMLVFTVPSGSASSFTVCCLFLVLVGGYFLIEQSLLPTHSKAQSTMQLTAFEVQRMPALLMTSEMQMGFIPYLYSRPP